MHLSLGGSNEYIRKTYNGNNRGSDDYYKEGQCHYPILADKAN